MKTVIVTITVLISAQLVYSELQEVIPLWPGDVPGETESKAPAVISDNHGGNTLRICKVTDPALVVYQPDSGRANGAAVIICPGGGYNNLCADKEGSEIGRWLNTLGYTAFVLQYRVPKKQAGALQDALRAIRMVRGLRSQWGLDANRIGLMGFSAGGSLSARAGTRYGEAVYNPVDELDAISARPDFAILIYPAYLDQGPENTLTPELTVDQQTPPMFLFVAANDKHANSSLVMASALRKKNVPVELHMLPEGGHGFGIRKGNVAACVWPALCEEWMRRTVLP